MPEYITPEHPLHAELEPLIRALTNDPHHQRFHDELLIKSRIFELMYRIFPYCETARKDTVYDDFVYEKLQRSLAFLEENYPENLTIKKMAAVSNYSESHFSKLFRELTGESFTQYLKNYRLDTAAERIRNVALPICLTFRARSAKGSVCPHPNFAGNGTIFLDFIYYCKKLLFFLI